MGRIHLKNEGEHNIKNTKQGQWPEQRPDIPQKTAVIPHLESRPSEREKKPEGVA